MGEVLIHVGSDVSRCAPAGTPVLDATTVFLGVFALDIDRQPNGDGGGNAHAQVKRMQAGQRVCKGGSGEDTGKLNKIK